MGKRKENRSVGRPSGRWKDNIKMDLQEIEWAMWTEFIFLRIGTIGRLL
jgi:hypothetical protein